MNSVAVVAMIISGALLPLMELVFGKFVTVFQEFTVGTASADDFRASINQYTFVLFFSHIFSYFLSSRGLTKPRSRLYFIYLFVAKFLLVYIWTVSLPLSIAVHICPTNGN